MSIPLTGAFIIGFTIWLFLFSPRHLYSALVFSLPFSATAVLNFGAVGEGKSIMAWQFVGMMWILRESLCITPAWRRPGWTLTRDSRRALIAFMIAVIASLSVPLLLNGTEWVPSDDAFNSQTVPLRFSMYNVTQTAYLAFGVVLAFLVAAENCRTSKLIQTLRLYVWSCTFVAGWGLFQLWCNLTGHEYPAFLFNTSANMSALGYTEILSAGITRISSAALEPSILGEELLLAFVVLLIALKIGRPIISRNCDYLALSLMSGALLASTSTTAYVGLAIALLLAAIALFSSGISAKAYVFVFSGLVGVAALAIKLIPVVGDIASIVLVNKADTGSGISRLHSVSLAFYDFLSHPIFGAGWHAVDSNDLICLILANTGIVGLIAFGVFLLPIVRNLSILVRKGKPSAILVWPLLLLLLALQEGSGLAYSTGYVWVFFGLAAAVSAHCYQGVMGLRNGVSRVCTSTAPNSPEHGIA